MAKLILLSIVLVSMAVPIWLSGRPAPRRALRSAQWLTVAFVLIWGYLCVSLYPQLVPLE